MTLPTECLAIGYSSKVGKTNQIGQFGEGLKLGALALVRNCHQVNIDNSGDIWDFVLETLSEFNCDTKVLKVKVTPTCSPSNSCSSSSSSFPRSASYSRLTNTKTSESKSKQQETEKQRVVVTINNITKKDWDKCRQNFRFDSDCFQRF